MTRGYVAITQTCLPFVSIIVIHTEGLVIMIPFLVIIVLNDSLTAGHNTQPDHCNASHVRISAAFQCQTHIIATNSAAYEVIEALLDIWEGDRRESFVKILACRESPAQQLGGRAPNPHATCIMRAVSIKILDNLALSAAFQALVRGQCIQLMQSIASTNSTHSSFWFPPHPSPEDQVCIQRIKVQAQKMAKALLALPLAVCMGQHARLGQSSVLLAVDEAILQMVVVYALY